MSFTPYLIDEDVADGGEPGVHLQAPQQDAGGAEQQPGSFAPLRLQPDLVPVEAGTKKRLRSGEEGMKKKKRFAPTANNTRQMTFCRSNFI